MSKRPQEKEQRISVETAGTLAAMGARIRELRSQAGMTLQAMGNLTGLSPSMLSLVERGQTSPSIGTLVVICSALGIHMSDLLAVQNQSGEGLVSRAQRQPIFETSRGVLRRILREDRTHGIEIAINEYEPGTGSADSPVHHVGFEYGIVLEGELAVEVDGTSHVLSPGDLISYDSSRGHRIWNHSAGRVRALWVNLERS
jgi:transcriptional regulator with XRE-family HTH domain